MSFIRRYRPSLNSLELSAEKSWCQHTLKMVGLYQLIVHERSASKPGDEVVRLAAYMGRLIPLDREEILFSRILAVLSQDTSEKNVQTEFLDADSSPNVRVLFISLFYRPRFKNLELTCSSGDPNSAHILQSLLRESIGEPSLSTLRLKLFNSPNLSIEEYYLLKRLIRSLTNLKSLTLWYAADNFILHIIQETCPHLQQLDVWKSVKVTDRGVSMFLGEYGCTQSSKSVLYLKKIMLRETSVTSQGLLEVVRTCPSLEYIEYSKGPVTDGFLSLLSENYEETNQTFQLHTIFLPVNNFNQLSNIVHSLPSLRKLSLCTSLKILPDLRKDDLQHVRSLQLSSIQDHAFFNQILTLIGSQLISLELNSLHFTLDVSIVGEHCSNLEELRLFSSTVRVGRSRPVSDDHDSIPSSSSESHFSRIRSLHLFLPETKGEVNVLEYIMLRGLDLQNIQVTGSDCLNHTLLIQILLVNPLVKLRRLILSVPANDMNSILDLTNQSVREIQQSCPEIQCIGDLRHWRVERPRDFHIL